MTRLREASLPENKQESPIAGLAYRFTPASWRFDTEYPNLSKLGPRECAVRTSDYLNGRLLDEDGRTMPPPPGDVRQTDPMAGVTPPVDVVWKRGR
jgi:hypothetical protein